MAAESVMKLAKVLSTFEAMDKSGIDKQTELKIEASLQSIEQFCLKQRVQVLNFQGLVAKNQEQE